MRRTTRMVATLLFVGSALSALAAEKKVAAPAQSPETKKTVEAFTGKWTFEATLAAPGAAKPETFPMTMDCRTSSLGRAVACSAKAKTSSGPWEGSVMVGFDPWSKAVHFMSMMSDGEFHDHVCHWSGDSDLTCDPLKGGMETEDITEELSFRVEGKGGLSFRSVTTMKDGSKMDFSAKGKRK